MTIAPAPGDPEAAAAPGDPPVRPGPGRLLVVEDEQHLNEALSLRLRTEGYEVSPFYDGRAAWEALQGELPDAVLLDLGLPDIDGLELIDRLRGSARHRKIPVIVMTARSELLIESRFAPSDREIVLLKPFSRALLLRAVHELLDPTSPEVVGKLRP